MGKPKREKKLHLWHPSPWDGVPGVRATVLRLAFNLIGPAALGARHWEDGPEEQAPPAPEHPPCPACGQPLDEHDIVRGGPGKSTHMICPTPKAEAA
ncbi:hypothetical protein [Agrococcus casei]|uniref:Uncharacterized protein n=1 Tax=Agrococcus casei LMG 22410 TaxID=1255656 RepID=A0A1R4GLV7_9MICO|nr:hypothetical protein [Agrococcus casei]SJM69063.1 hypothetical protein CZ674_13000 [Agrococcus casei LMG 22410]